MKTKILWLAAIVAAATFFYGCSSNGVSNSDVSSLINGPSSIKGKITGKRLDNTAYSFDYDFHVTTNDGNSASEGYTDSENGDTLIYVWQYFYFDRNGYSDYGDNSSASGQFTYLEFEAKVSTKKGVTTITAVPKGNSNQYYYGMWQNITTDGARFVYGSLYYYSYQGYQVPPTLDITGLAYDRNSQLLSGKVSMALADGNDVEVDSGNHNATTITGDFKIYVPKEHFDVTKSNGNSGNLYRRGR